MPSDHREHGRLTNSSRSAQSRGHHLVIASETKQSIFLARLLRRSAPRNDILFDAFVLYDFGEFRYLFYQVKFYLKKVEFCFGLT